MSAGAPLSASFVSHLATLPLLTSCSRLNLTPVTRIPPLSLRLPFFASVSAFQKPSLATLFKLAQLPPSYSALFSVLALALCGIMFMDGQVIVIYSTVADFSTTVC